MFVWAVTHGSFEFSVLSTDIATLTDHVARVVAPCYSLSATADEDIEDWHLLGKAVLETVQDRVNEASTLLVSPAGPLHYVSFEPFVEGKAVVYVPSATIGLRPGAARADHRQFAAEFVGFGNPAFDRNLPEFADLPSLPGAELEVKEIAALFGDAGVAVCGMAAVEPEVRAWARRCRYLHLATHGIADLENPLRSGLVLASPVGVPLHGADFDDVLYGYEMVDLGIEAELVVCASCYTGFGDLRAGEGMATMGGALLQGGARWVLVTLWPVGDMITAMFTLALYHALLEGAAVPAAVEAARAEIRDYHEHPRWWAPFVLFGAQR
jgi:CHAT domain-containing protein